MFDYSSVQLTDLSMETTKTSYQADTKDSAKMNKVEPLQLPDEPKAHKNTTLELQLAEAETNTESGLKPRPRLTPTLKQTPAPQTEWYHHSARPQTGEPSSQVHNPPLRSK